MRSYRRQSAADDPRQLLQQEHPGALLAIPTEIVAVRPVEPGAPRTIRR